mmetsp:Transcript_39590/g.100430  ORF Transcript_39590/g.100430 Transcript_39590/m.100430 type:complete len:338 (-) Transcript_39590:53-1066(-)
MTLRCCPVQDTTRCPRAWWRGRRSPWLAAIPSPPGCLPAQQRGCQGLDSTGRVPPRRFQPAPRTRCWAGRSRQSERRQIVRCPRARATTTRSPPLRAQLTQSPARSYPPARTPQRVYLGRATTLCRGHSRAERRRVRPLPSPAALWNASSLGSWSPGRATTRMAWTQRGRTALPSPWPRERQRPSQSPPQGQGMSTYRTCGATRGRHTPLAASLRRRRQRRVSLAPATTTSAGSLTAVNETGPRTRWVPSRQRLPGSWRPGPESMKTWQPRCGRWLGPPSACLAARRSSRSRSSRPGPGSTATASSLAATVWPTPWDSATRSGASMLRNFLARANTP